MGGVDSTDPSRSEQAEDPARESDSARLADAALDLLACSTADDVYEVMCAFMGALCPDAVVVINEVDPDGDFLVARKVIGLEDSLVAKAANIFGVGLDGSRWAIHPEYMEEVVSGRLSQVPGGIAELIGREIPRSVAEAGARLFGSHSVFTVGIADGCQALGSIRILTRTVNPSIPTHIIESFARHCYSALAAIRAATELTETAERNRLILRNMTEGIALHEIVLDDDGVPCDYRFLDVNPAFEKLTGLNRDDIIGRTAREVLCDVEPMWVQRYGLVATTGVPARFEDYASAPGRHYSVVAYSPQHGQFVAVVSDVTEREHAQRALASSEAKFAAAFHTSPDAVNINRLSDGLYLDVNQGFTELTGFTKEDVAGKTSQDIDIWFDLEDRRRLVAGLQAHGMVNNLEAQFRRKDGSLTTALMSARIMEIDGEQCILSVTRDISDRRAAEAALWASELRYRTAIQTAMDGFWFADRDRRIRGVNEAYCRMSGYSEDELVGMEISELEADESTSDIDAHNRLIMERGHDRFESRHRRKDGTVYDAEVSVSYQPTDGGQFVSFIRDITERKEAEQAILALNAELEERVAARTEELAGMNERLRVTNESLIKANELLEQATRAKSEFLASMSHELRTPLNSVIGFTGVLMQGLAGPVNAEQQLQLRMVSDSGHHLLSLIDDILDLSKIESGKTTAVFEDFEVVGVADNALGMIRPLAEDKGVELVLNCDAGVGTMRSDPRLLSQILLNLLGNAVKFTDAGVISLAISRDDEAISFDVADTGRGIHPNDMAHIMESFYQAESLAEAKIQGTGLGLAISSRLAEMLGGSIEVSSELGVGSTFTLRIPLATGDE